MGIRVLYMMPHAISNHSSASKVLTVGLSRGSSFIVFNRNRLSSSQTSQGVMWANGFIESRLLLMIQARTSCLSSPAISTYDLGERPKNSLCLIKILIS